MNKYTIYCTEEQTKKALELGAPIDAISSSTNEDITTISCFKLDTPIYTDINEGGFDYALNPTAEQMIGWLEERGIWIHFCKPNQRPELLSYSVSKSNEPFKRAFIGGGYSSRKEVTLAAIDAALDCL